MLNAGPMALKTGDSNRVDLARLRQTEAEMLVKQNSQRWYQLDRMPNELTTARSPMIY